MGKVALEYTTVFSLDQVTLSHNRDAFSGLVSNVQVLAFTEPSASEMAT